MNGIYRLRPAKDILIEELEESYLWFSRPTEFNDVEDSNIFSFAENNESIKSSFVRLFHNYKNISELSGQIGICCFSKTLPEINLWEKFPYGHNGVFIKYDLDVLGSIFQNTFGLPNCFKEVEYFSSPVLFKKYSTNDIVWERTKNGELYKSLLEIEKDERLRDELFLKMFTRINNKFSFQNEVRVILGGDNIPDKSIGIKGYKVKIPQKAILSIFFHTKTPTYIIDKIKKLDITINFD